MEPYFYFQILFFADHFSVHFEVGNVLCKHVEGCKVVSVVWQYVNTNQGKSNTSNKGMDTGEGGN